MRVRSERSAADTVDLLLARDLGPCPSGAALRASVYPPPPPGARNPPGPVAPPEVHGAARTPGRASRSTNTSLPRAGHPSECCQREGLAMAALDQRDRGSRHPSGRRPVLL